MWHGNLSWHAPRDDADDGDPQVAASMVKLENEAAVLNAVAGQFAKAAGLFHADRCGIVARMVERGDRPFRRRGVPRL